MTNDEASRSRARWAQQCSRVIQNIICPHLLAALCIHTSAGEDLNMCVCVCRNACFAKYQGVCMSVYARPALDRGGQVAI